MYVVAILCHYGHIHPERVSVSLVEHKRENEMTLTPSFFVRVISISSPPGPLSDKPSVLQTCTRCENRKVVSWR